MQSLYLSPLLLRVPLFIYSEGLYRNKIYTPLTPYRQAIGSNPAAFAGLFLFATSTFPALWHKPVRAGFWCLTAFLGAIGITFILITYFLTQMGDTLRRATITVASGSACSPSNWPCAATLLRP